jgi:hypothetical protein
MPEARENLPLLAKALGESGGEDVFLQDLQRDLLLIDPVGALGEIDGAHAAAPELFEQAIVAEDCSGEAWLGGCSLRALLPAFDREHGTGLAVVGEQLLGFGCEFGVRGFAMHEGRSLRRR